MKISSQLANNFDYCSTEIGVFLNKELFTLRPQRLSGESSGSLTSRFLSPPRLLHRRFGIGEVDQLFDRL